MAPGEDGGSNSPGNSPHYTYFLALFFNWVKNSGVYKKYSTLCSWLYDLPSAHSGLRHMAAPRIQNTHGLTFDIQLGYIE